MKNLKFILLPILSIFMSCDKERQPSFNQTDMWNCHHESTWDEATAKLALLGEWELKHISCSGRQGTTTGEPTEDFSIEFQSDNTLIVKQSGAIIQTSIWNIVEGDVDFFALTTDPAVSEIRGRILFCADVIEFSNSYVDGCDNYFSRKN